MNDINYKNEQNPVQTKEVIVSQIKPFVKEDMPVRAAFYVRVGQRDPNPLAIRHDKYPTDQKSQDTEAVCRACRKSTGKA